MQCYQAGETIVILVFQKYYLLSTILRRCKPEIMAHVREET